MEKVYVVKDELGDDERDVWTISTTQEKAGWETDSGYDGYGLSKEKAEFYAHCINSYEILVEALDEIAGMEEGSLHYPHVKTAVEALEKIKKD